MGNSNCGNAGRGHDIYENAGTCMDFGRFVTIAILLMINDLSIFSLPGTAKKGELNIRDGPTMLLKTKENRSGNLDGPTMLMKTSTLIF
jgi:hypothetical protein